MVLLSAFLKVSYQYWNASHNASCFVDDGGRWERAVRTVLQVVRTQQVSSKASCSVMSLASRVANS